MSDTELLLTELKTLPPAYREEALDFIGYLKQKAVIVHAAVPSRKTVGSANDKERARTALAALRGMYKDEAGAAGSFLDRKYAEKALEYRLEGDVLPENPK